MSVADSRMLHELALKSFSLDSMLNNREDKILLLETNSATREKDFVNLLNIEKDKNSIQADILNHTKALLESYKSEAKENRWQATKFKILAILEAVALVALVVIAL